jgi:hypothetical protein
LKKLKPNSIVYGYGPEEHKWVEDLSKSQTAGVPSDFSLNLPVMSRLKAAIRIDPKNIRSRQKKANGLYVL